ncbi:hypothetical protein [Photobacterium sp. Hal280]|uniref:hypothetical protein n=1 Tax=Photobacterium sp. Hal280 TaxID=3035163 RepID=UPI00301B8C0D
MRTLPTLIAGAVLISAPALADWHFRGTPNQWNAAAMTQIATTHYQTCQTFLQGDATGGPRFKIDRYGDWQESYPAGDYTVGGDQSYRIDFDSDSQTILTPCGQLRQLVSGAELPGAVLSRYGKSMGCSANDPGR